MITFLFIILILISCSLLYFYIQEKNKNIEKLKVNKDIEVKNKELEYNNNFLVQKKRELQNDIDIAQNRLNNMEEISQEAYQKYINNLEELYNNKEKEYDKLIYNLKESYDNQQDKILAEMAVVRQDLDNIVSTRAAAIQAQLKEEEIQQQAEYYSLSIDDIDKREVKILQSIEQELRDPRPVRMII